MPSERSRVWLLVGAGLSACSGSSPASPDSSAAPSVKPTPEASKPAAEAPPPDAEPEPVPEPRLRPDPGPEPAPGSGPVFASPTHDRNGDALPKGAVARLGSLEHERHLPVQWMRAYVRSTPPVPTWFEAKFRRRLAKIYDDDSPIIPRFRSDDGSKLVVCDYYGLAGCDIYDTTTRKRISSTPGLAKDHDWFFRRGLILGEYVVLLFNDQTIRGEVDPTRLVETEPDQLLVFNLADGKQVAAVDAEGEDLAGPAPGRVLLEGKTTLRTLTIPGLGDERVLDPPKATGWIPWSAHAAAAPRIAALLSESGPPKRETLVTWDAASGDVASELVVECTAVDLAPKGDVVACARPKSDDATIFDPVVELIDPTDGTVRHRLLGGYGHHTLQFSADGKSLVGHGNGVVPTRWTLADGRSDPLEHGHLHEIEAIAIAGDGEYAAVLDTGGGLRVWRLRDQTTRWFRNVGTFVAGGGRQIGFSGDGRTLVTAHFGGGCTVATIRRADGEPGPCLGPEVEQGGGYTSMAIVDDVAAVFTGGREVPEVWLVPLTGEPYQTVEVPNMKFATLRENALFQWDSHSVALEGAVIDIRDGSVDSKPITLRPLAGDRFLSQADAVHAKVFDADRKPLFELAIGDGKGHLSAFGTDDDGRVAVGNEFGAVAVFSPSGKRIASFQHDDGAAVTAMAFHPTEPILLTGSANATVLAWRLPAAPAPK